ncbi:unnamed protein product [Peronospora belbahrii]|uniref:START domain-containing protein n=1 Tax=Peronospora belbahrii TaxID=622444 RepID=A0ABN8CXI0_9STRA|nr:unnamed protein product [Peronospora belbahrii]
MICVWKKVDGVSSPSVNAEDSDNCAIVMKTTPRRHRVSRKEELEYLRKKVIEMEQQLKTLKDATASPAPLASSLKSNKVTMKFEQSVALWKKMAERQKIQREIVECENTKLREKLKMQMRMAKGLQRVLRKSERAVEQSVIETPKRYKHFYLDSHVANAPGEFDQLIANLGKLYALTNGIMSFCPMATEKQPVLRQQDVKHNNVNDVFIEFIHSKLLPFEKDVVDRAIWRHLTEPGIKYNTYFEEFAETKDNMILRKFGVEIEQDERVAKMGGKQAIRRYLERDQIVIVRSSVVDRVELSCASMGGLTFREVGWIVITDATGHDSVSSPKAMVSSYSTLTLDVDLDSQWEIGALTDFVLQSRGDIEVGNDNIVENLLLEEAAKRNSLSSVAEYTWQDLRNLRFENRSKALLTFLTSFPEYQLYTTTLGYYSPMSPPGLGPCMRSCCRVVSVEVCFEDASGVPQVAAVNDMEFVSLHLQQRAKSNLIVMTRPQLGEKFP